MNLKFTCLLALSVWSLAATAQTPEKPSDDLYSLSLEELMNVPINSASKKDETLFDAPLSSYTITRAEIDKAGSTSIMEALRLAPGVIVREETNGVYDIHLRGFDNALRYTQQPFTKSDFTTLVMIDNRPVFNNNLGGTFWESLPIDIHDVERIEIVRGPSAPLFGPNAVTGVINIITRRATGQGIYTDAKVQYTSNTVIANGAFGKNIQDKLSFILSGNYQDRDRFDDTYYSIPADKFVDPVTLFTGNSQNPQGSASNRFPNPGRALNKWGANGFVNYKPIDKVSLDLSIGLQKDEVQKAFLGVQGSSSQLTYFSTNRSDSRYANLAAQVYGIHIRSSFVDGHDNINVGSNPSQYNYTTFDATAEYGINIGEKNTITPGISYQVVDFTDKDYTHPEQSIYGFLNADRSINTVAGFVRTDINPSEHWRIMAAIRADKFSTPDKTRIAYELATTYKINQNNLIRAAITRSNSGSFIGNTYLNVTSGTGIPTAPTVKQTGNTNLSLLTVEMYEVGYRAQLSKSFQLDIDIFHQQMNDIAALLLTEVQATNLPSPPYPAIIPKTYQFQNVPTKLIQNGITLSLNYVPSEKIQFKPFVTVQHTETKDLPSDYVASSFNPTYSDSKHTNTPTWYGGFYFNYKATSRFNINLSSYTYARHTQYDYADKISPRTQGDISGKFLLNAKLNYTPVKSVNLFLNGRNILNSDSREFYGTDKIGGVYMIGAAITMN
ncbi:MAG TPA: TonB-dependent receptor plug domain-containing protein [Ohtaekwangia sp.]|uniref:TonB-dependent receptor plug domain-containing protein n=1 Tax=Ohtaekwangia sp. TaxID=2066019 RepID=UPI002F931079